MTELRGLDSNGARHLLTIGGVDGVVSAEIIGEFKLAVGRVFDAHAAQALTSAAHRLQVFDLAVSLLSVRARSARELGLALRRRGAQDDETRAAMTRLVELRLVDDAAYARNVARTKAVAGGMSKRRLQQELARRGVAAELARAAVGDVLEDVGLDEFESALVVARKRVRSLGTLDGPVMRRRLYAFLARRGYESSVITRAMAVALGGEADAQADD